MRIPSTQGSSLRQLMCLHERESTFGVGLYGQFSGGLIEGEYLSDDGDCFCEGESVGKVARVKGSAADVHGAKVIIQME